MQDYQEHKISDVESMQQTEDILIPTETDQDIDTRN